MAKDCCTGTVFGARDGGFVSHSLWARHLSTLCVRSPSPRPCPKSDRLVPWQRLYAINDESVFEPGFECGECLLFRVPHKFDVPGGAPAVTESQTDPEDRAVCSGLKHGGGG